MNQVREQPSPDDPTKRWAVVVDGLVEGHYSTKAEAELGLKTALRQIEYGNWVSTYLDRFAAQAIAEFGDCLSGGSDGEKEEYFRGDLQEMLRG